MYFETIQSNNLVKHNLFNTIYVCIIHKLFNYVYCCSNNIIAGGYS